jgi:hypothetical protein
MTDEYTEDLTRENPHLQRPIHPWRWRFIALWIIVFTALVFWAIRENRSAIDQLNENKASIISLERTNCALRSFLHSAYTVRVKTAHDQKADPKAREAAREAALGYYRLFVLFPKDGCVNVLKGGH